MKSVSYILLTCLCIVLYGCKEEEHPYVGYIAIEDVMMEAAGGTVTLIADTDISDPIRLEVNETASEWCSVSVNGKEITVTTTRNISSIEDIRSTNIQVRCGYRVTSFLVAQDFEGRPHLDWDDWEVTGSDVQENDGGGYPSLLDEDRTTFWHSQYSPSAPLPHWLLIDMKKEQPIAMIRIGRRHHTSSGNNYPSVKEMEVYTSNDNENFTLAGGFSFSLPWTAPDGTVVTGNSPLVPAYEDVIFPEILNARYIKLVITETNNDTGVCQVSYIKAFDNI